MEGFCFNISAFISIIDNDKFITICKTYKTKTQSSNFCNNKNNPGSVNKKKPMLVNLRFLAVSQQNNVLRCVVYYKEI